MSGRKNRKKDLRRRKRQEKSRRERKQDCEEKEEPVTEEDVLREIEHTFAGVVGVFFATVGVIVGAVWGIYLSESLGFTYDNETLVAAGGAIILGTAGFGLGYLVYKIFPWPWRFVIGIFAIFTFWRGERIPWYRRNHEIPVGQQLIKLIFLRRSMKNQIQEEESN